MSTIDARTLLTAYAAGMFPMAASREAKGLGWFRPGRRGIIRLDGPLDGFHVPRRLQRTIQTGVARTGAASGRFDIRINTAFGEVMRECAGPRPGHDDSWINDEILALYGELHAMGHAHSVEVYQETRLAGGLYGVSLGGAFFGESMFSRLRDASKIALVFLVERLRARGFQLLDTQYLTEHLRQFGTVEVSARTYAALLERALKVSAVFD